MGGMHGEAYTNYAIQECDVLLAVGARLDDRLTGAFSTFAPKAQHHPHRPRPGRGGQDDARSIPPVIGDALLTLRALLPLVAAQAAPRLAARRSHEWRHDTDRRDLLAQESDELVPPYIMRQLWHADRRGQLHGRAPTWASTRCGRRSTSRTRSARSLITSGGLGTMGFGLPAAIGAQIGRPDEEVWVVAGDGGFQMTMPELSTVVAEKLPVKIGIINNGYLGMVRQWQDIFYEQRYSGTPLFNPDFAKIADAYGIPAITWSGKADVAEAIRPARAHRGPFLLNFKVEPLINVYPMVAPGKSNAEMIRRPLPAMEAEEE